MTKPTEPPPKAETMKRGEGARFVLAMIAEEARKSAAIGRAELEAELAAEAANADTDEPG